MESCLKGMTDETAQGAWRLTAGGREIFMKPRVSVMRSIMLNHWYHHRGQLSVYLRLLDVPVPVIYGRSADEDPFCGICQSLGWSRRLRPLETRFFCVFWVSAAGEGPVFEVECWPSREEHHG